MTRNDKLILTAPLLVAVYDPVQLALHNAGEFSAIEFAAGLFATIVIAALVMALALLLFRRRGVFASGLVACVWIGALLLGGSVAELLTARRDGPLTPADAVWLLAAVALALTFLIVRGHSPHRDALRGVAIAMAGVLAWDGGSILLDAVRAGAARPVNVGNVHLARSAVPRDSLPDIYIVILDQYASAHVLRAVFGYDDTPFLDSLRTRGFTLPHHAYTNYRWTVRTLDSMLNMRHLDEMMREYGLPSYSVPATFEHIRVNNTFALAKAHGYRVLLVPSWDFPGTQGSPLADAKWNLARPGDALAVFMGRQYPAILLRRSAPGFLMLSRRGGAITPAVALSPFLGLEHFSHARGPKLVFAHTMVTHTPYLFDADCHYVGAVNTGDPGVEPAYVHSVECANRQVLAMVDTLRRNATRPTIIVLMGDHGTKILGLHDHRGDINQVDEQHGALSVLLLPGGRDFLPDTLTPVNLIPVLFNHYLGDSLPLRSNAAYQVPVNATPPFVPVYPNADPY